MNTQTPRRSLQRKQAARIAAVQAIYRAGITGQSLGSAKLVDQLIEQWKEIGANPDPDWQVDVPPEPSLLRSIVTGVAEHEEAITAQLQSAVNEKWKAERMSTVLVAILKAAIYELMYVRKTPSNVIINEYVTITNAFHDAPEVDYVNGALNQLARSLRSEQTSETHG